MKTYTESNRIRPHILTASVYWAIALLMAFCIIAHRIYGEKGSYFTAGAFGFFGFFYTGLVLACQKAVYIMVRLRARRSQYLNAEANMHRSLNIFGAAGVILGILLAALSYRIAGFLFHGERGFFQLIIVAVCGVLMGVQGVLRGYLQGIGYTKPILIADLLVALVSGITGTVATIFLYSYGLKVNDLFHVDEYSAVYGSVGVMLGLLAGTLTGLIQILISYHIRKAEIKDVVKGGAPRYLDNKNDVIAGVRVILLLYVTAAVALIVDEVYFVLHSVRVHPDGDFMSNFGSYFGRGICLVALFTVLCCIPFIKSWNRVMARVERDEYEGARERLKKLIRFSGMLVIPVGIFMLAIPQTLQITIYGKSNELANTFTMVSGVLVIVCAVGMFFSWFLNHMGRSILILLNVGVGWGIHALGLFVFVTILDRGIYGIQMATLAAVVIYDLMCTVITFKMLKLKVSTLKVWTTSLLSSATAGFVIFLLNMLLTNLIGEVLTFILCVIVFFVIYMLIMIVTGGIRKHELGSIPLGGLFKGFAAMVQPSRLDEE